MTQPQVHIISNLASCGWVYLAYLSTVKVVQMKGTLFDLSAIHHVHVKPYISHSRQLTMLQTSLDRQEL